MPFISLVKGNCSCKDFFVCLFTELVMVIMEKELMKILIKYDSSFLIYHFTFFFV